MAVSQIVTNNSENLSDFSVLNSGGDFFEMWFPTANCGAFGKLEVCALSYWDVRALTDMSEIGFPGFLHVWRTSIAEPSPRLNNGVISKISCGFKILPIVRMVRAIFGVVYGEKLETACASLLALFVELFVFVRFFVGCGKDVNLGHFQS